MCQRLNIGNMDDLLTFAVPISTISPLLSSLESKLEPVPEGGHKSEAVYGGHG
jgi:hypothetical protein